MATDTGRPQDQGRRHRKRGAPSSETSTLLGEYQAAMRDELRAVLLELRPVAPTGTLELVDEPPKRPSLADRSRLWDLAIKLGRELGTEIDPGVGVGGDPSGTPAAAGPRKWRRARVEFGPDR